MRPDAEKRREGGEHAKETLTIYGLRQLSGKKNETSVNLPLGCLQRMVKAFYFILITTCASNSMHSFFLPCTHSFHTIHVLSLTNCFAFSYMIHFFFFLIDKDNGHSRNHTALLHPFVELLHLCYAYTVQWLAGFHNTDQIGCR